MANPQLNTLGLTVDAVENIGISLLRSQNTNQKENGGIHGVYALKERGVGNMEYEHKIRTIPIKDFPNQANVILKKGWVIERILSWNENDYSVLFKREKEE